MSARPSRRLRQVYDGVVISLPFFSTADLVTLTEVCVPLRAALHENGEVADAAWASLTFFGPYPFGYRSCATGLAHSARMIVPVLLETLLRRHGLRVRTFTVTDCLFHDACLILVQRFCPNLLSLNLSQSEHRYQLNSPIFPSCLSSASLIGLKHCPSITSLQLRHTHITDRCLAVLVQHLKKLQEIDLSGCTAVTQSGFLELLQLRQLSRVSLRATRVTDYAISNLILVLEGLLFLDISSCPKVTNQCLVNLNALLKCRVVPHPGPHIESLPLMMNIMASCVSLGTAASMVLELVPSFTGSEELGPLDSVDSLSLSTDFGGGAPSRMSTFGDEFTEVELAERESHLPNMGPPPLASASDKADGTDAFSHIRFRLQSLIMRNVNVNYILMMYIARFFPDLRRLDLSGSRHLNTLPFRDLALACTTLESLEFRDCARVNDESLIHVFSSLSRHSLTRLNLFGCHLVSDASLVYLFNNCTRIRSLNIVDCAHITNMCLTKLTQLPLLTRLDVGNSCTTASQINPGISPLGISLFMNARGCSYGLITLRLYAGTADDLVLSVISQRCHNLKELFVQATPPSAKQLTSKDVVFESKTDKAAITSRGMYHLAYGVCTSLTRLQLVGCDSVEFEGMRFLSEHPPPRLIDLQLRNCKGVGVRVHQMMARSPFGQLQLRRLSICEDLCSVVLDGARALLAGCRCLEMFEVRSCKLLPPLEAPETQAMLRSLPSLPPLLEWYPGTTGVILTQDLW